MFFRIWKFLYAKYRGFAPVSCLESPHADVLRGVRRWRWLTLQRKTGREIDPTVRVRCPIGEVDQRLELGAGVQLDHGVNVWMADECGQRSRINIGNSVYIGPNSFLGSCHQLKIGNDSMIGANCYLTTVNHVTDKTELPYSQQGYRGGDLVIGSNVWLGSNVVVLPGVTINDHAIIGAGAVVTKDVPSGETWGGVPARKIFDGSKGVRESIEN